MLGYGYWIFEFLFVRASRFDTSIITHNRLTIHLIGPPNRNLNLKIRSILMVHVCLLHAYLSDSYANLG